MVRPIKPGQRGGSKLAGGTAGFAGLMLLGGLGPLLAVGFLVTKIGETPQVVESGPVAEETFVVTQTVAKEQLLDIAVSGSDPVDVVAGLTSGGGVVTQTHVEPGDTLQDGDPVISVDGESLIVAVTREPFHRDLKVGASGRDVRALQQWLTSQGYLPAGNIDGVYGTGTARAVQEMNRHRGEYDPSTTFSPSHFLWLPQEGLEVAEVLINVGSAAPGQGERILSTTRVYDSASVRLPDGGEPHLEGIWDLITDGRTIGVVENGRLAAHDIQQLAAIGLAAATTTEHLTDHPSSITVTVRARSRITHTRNVVPVGSVISLPDPSDSTRDISCLYVSDGASYIPFETEVVGGDFGVLFIDPSPDTGDPVLVNPVAFLEHPRCE